MSDDTLGPDLEARLRGELDGVQPLHTSPRYRATTTKPLPWRLAPTALAAALVAILALSAVVATGSPNPVVWGEKVITIIESSSTVPTPSPGPVKHSPTPTPSHEQERESPEPRQTTEPSDDHSGEGTSGGGISGEGTSGEGTSGDGTSGESTSGESTSSEGTSGDLHDGYSGSSDD